MRRKQILLKNNNGMTMVEVLMGFVILVIMLGLLSGIVVVSTNIYYSSVDLKRAEEKVQEVIYSDLALSEITPEPVSISLVPVKTIPGASGERINLPANLYKLSSITILKDLETDNLDFDITMIKHQ